MIIPVNNTLNCDVLLTEINLCHYSWLSLEKTLRIFFHDTRATFALQFHFWGSLCLPHTSKKIHTGMNSPRLSALLTIASCKPRMGTAHFSIKLVSWWTGMGSACVVLQFKLVLLQWTWKVCKCKAKWRSLAPLTVCEIITNKDSFRRLFQWDFAPKLYFYIFTGCKIKSSLWKYYAEEDSCEWSSDHRIFVYRLGFCLF